MKKFTQKSLSLLRAAICSFSVGASAMPADFNEPPATFTAVSELPEAEYLVR